jgi:hypothetical protein
MQSVKSLVADGQLIEVGLVAHTFPKFLEALSASALQSPTGHSFTIAGSSCSNKLVQIPA